MHLSITFCLFLNYILGSEMFGLCTQLKVFLIVLHQSSESPCLMFVKRVSFTYSITWRFVNLKSSHSAGEKTINSCFKSFTLLLSSSLQEMLAIMKSIYDMMGRYTYPCVRDEAPYEHVDKFFQVLNAREYKNTRRPKILFQFLLK